MAHDPDAVNALLEQGATIPEWEVLSASTEELISRREKDLVAYQSKIIC
jgi:hypothetical protein